MRLTRRATTPALHLPSTPHGQNALGSDPFSVITHILGRTCGRPPRSRYVSAIIPRVAAPHAPFLYRRETWLSSFLPGFCSRSVSLPARPPAVEFLARFRDAESVVSGKLDTPRCTRPSWFPGPRGVFLHRRHASLAATGSPGVLNRPQNMVTRHHSSLSVSASAECGIAHSCRLWAPLFLLAGLCSSALTALA